MTHSGVIENKISSVRKYLNILERYKGYSRDEIERNIDIRGAVERYLYLAVQAAIDLSEAYISFRNYRKPSTLSENFYILEENGEISGEMAQILVRMTGFRNVIAHDYDDMNYSVVYDVLQNRLIEIADFTRVIENKIND